MHVVISSYMKSFNIGEIAAYEIVSICAALDTNDTNNKEVKTMAKNGSEKKSTEKVESRRAQIIKLVQQDKWTVEKLADKLTKLNSTWEVKKNKQAITGTLADLKKKGWTVEKGADGVIKVEATAAK